MGIPSFANAPAPNAATDLRYLAVPGAYNIARGLSGWMQAVGSAKTTVSNSWGNAPAIVTWGDSIMESAYNSATSNSAPPSPGGVAGYLRDSWLHQLKYRLQSRYNSISPVTGDIRRSFGFVPTVIGSAGWIGASNAQSLFVTDSGSGWPPTTTSINPNLTQGAVVANKAIIIGAAGNNGRIRLDIDPTDVAGAFYGYSVTDIEVVYNRTTNSGNIIVDVYTGVNYGTMITPGTGDFTSTTNANGGLSLARRILTSGLSRNTKYSIQISTTAVSANVAGYISGVVLWDGYGQGITAHNCSHFGFTIVGATNSNSSQPQATIDSWGQNAINSNAKLYVNNFILNDVGPGVSPAVDITTFTTQYNALVNAQLALPSTPSVLLVIPVNRSNSNFIANAPPYRQAIYNIANANPNRVAVLDLWYSLDPNYGDAMNNVLVPNGGAMSDKTHLSAIGGAWMMDQFYKVLTQ